MCQRLDSLDQSISTYAAAFDVIAHTPEQASQVASRCSRIIASLSAVHALAAARAAEGRGWQAAGYRSAAGEVADQSGISPAKAKRLLDTGRRLAAQPDVAQAALEGALSAEQASFVAEGAEADPSQAQALIAKAAEGSLSELAEEVARIKAANLDQEARRQARHARRSLRRWSDTDGACHTHLYGHPEDGALLWRMLDPVRRRLNLVRRQHGTTNQPFDVLDYDAIVLLAGLAVGRSDLELAVSDLLDLGLFPQMQAEFAERAATDSPDSSPAPGDSGAAPDPCAILFDQPPPAAAYSAVPEPPSASSERPYPPPERPSPPPEVSKGPQPVGPEAPEGPPLAGGRGPAGSATRPGEAGALASPGPTTSAQSRRGRAGAAPPGRGRRRTAGSAVKVMIRVDLDALLRGFPMEGELCEIAGHGPVPVSAIEAIIASDSPFLIGVLTRAEQVVGVYHHRRRPSTAQKSALDFVYPTCAATGCSARAGLQYDHREDWARTKLTAFDFMDRLCWHHHGLKTQRGWSLVPGRGKRPFVPPEDPRHPRHLGRDAPTRRPSAPTDEEPPGVPTPVPTRSGLATGRSP
jgi:hypothetical protein